MADGVFLVGGQLGATAVVAGDEEDGVITEAVSAYGVAQDDAVQGTLADERCRVGNVPHSNHDTVKASTPLAVGDSYHIIQKLVQIGLIVGVLAGIARGVHAGSAV